MEGGKNLAQPRCDFRRCASLLATVDHVVPAMFFAICLPRSVPVVLVASLAAVVGAAGARSDVAGAAAAESLAEARRLAAQFLFNDAHAAYRRAEAEPSAAREARFGQALTLLNVQPQTTGNVALAARLLDRLVAETETEESDLAVAARYFRARIDHLHLSPPDVAAAAQRYAALYRAHPDHPLGGQALVKLAILQLYDRDDTRERGAQLEEWAAAAAGLADPVARRDLHLVLGDAAQFFALPPAVALAQLRAGYALGVEELGARASLLVTMAELARASGQSEVAAGYYREFLANFRRDTRVATVRERLREMEDSLGMERRR